jgi:hypothetical protein
VHGTLDVGTVLVLPNDPHQYKVIGMEFMGFPVYKLTVTLQEIDDEDQS